jgi:parallel beta helix pectate lyase-like protein
MRSARFAAVACVTLVVCSFPRVALAQATRTWVSGVGNDANPCSRTAPCSTWAGAISKTAASGEIDALDPGGFGAVTLNKSITIDGISGLSGILASGTNAVVVNAAASDVVIIRNIDINGIGGGLSGIVILAAGDVRIENCKIYGFTNRGVLDQRATGHLEIVNTIVSNNGQTGILTLPAVFSSLTVTLDRVQMDNNGNAGLATTNGTQTMVKHSIASSNIHGFYADSGAVTNLDDSSAFSNVGTGINSQTGATIRLFSTNVTNNGTGLSTAGGGSILSYGMNRIAGNGAGNGPPTGSIPVQ